MAYDANGNVLGLKRTDKTGYMVDHLSLTYKRGTNQLMSVSDAAGANKLQGWDAGSSTNQYDLNGNIISGDGATQIVYDVRNLPIRMQKGGQTIIYRYNAAGQRIYKKVIGTTITEEHYVMNGSELVAVLKNGVVDYWKTSYGRYERINGTFRAKYYLTDHLGSTRVVLDESGTRTEAYDYYAFGLVLPGRGFGNTTKEKFTGKERDIETGWDYFGARYYNPTIARWMNVDPLADKFPSLSPYNYVNNTPTMIVDSNGEDWYRFKNENGDWEYRWRDDLTKDNAKDKLGDGEEYFGRRGLTSSESGDTYYLHSDGSSYNYSEISRAAQELFSTINEGSTEGSWLRSGAFYAMAHNHAENAIGKLDRLHQLMSSPDIWGVSTNVSGIGQVLGQVVSFGFSCTSTECGIWAAGGLGLGADVGLNVSYNAGTYVGQGVADFNSSMGLTTTLGGSAPCGGPLACGYSYSEGLNDNYARQWQNHSVSIGAEVGVTPTVALPGVTFSGTVTYAIPVLVWKRR